MHSCYAALMKGAYCLLMILDEDVGIRVGALGRVGFPKGVYAYAGSARGGIGSRVRRHLSASKKRRWHIDYLLSAAHIVTVISVPTDERGLECEIARSLLGIPGAEVVAKRFGSSDCGCPAHLVHLVGEDYESLLEIAAARISRFCCPYPETVPTC